MNEGPVDCVAAFLAGPPDDVQLLIDAERYSAAIILMFAAMEALGQALRRYDGKPTPSRDFQIWVTTYLQIPGDGPTSEEWWLTRCAIQHSHGVMTEKHEHDSNKAIVLWVRADEKRAFRRTLHAGHLVVVNILAMHEAFRSGVQTSLVDAAQDKAWWPKIEKRLMQFVQPIPVDPTGNVARLVYEG